MKQCQLCFSDLPIDGNFLHKTNRQDTKFQELICRKYLSTENWNSGFNVYLFCQECGKNIRELRMLDHQIEQVNIQIKLLVNRINEKISNGRNIQIQAQADLISSSIANDSKIVPVSDSPVFDKDFDDPWPDSPKSFQLSHAEDIGEESMKTLSENEHSVNKSLQTDANIQLTTKTKGITNADLQHRKSCGTFECPKCNKKFSRMDLLKRHECETETYECEVCNKSFSSKVSLQTHSRIHEEKRHKCEICEKRFTLPHHLRLHMLIHTGEKPHECKICKRRFRDKSSVKPHMLTHSQDEKEKRKYSCEICSKTFTKFQTLKDHVVKHTKDAKYKCGTCGKAFESMSRCKVHEKIHKDDRNFKCTQCWKAFKLKGALKQHLLTHKGEKSFQCENCGKGFITIGQLNFHIQLKHTDDGRDFVCKICGNIYKSESQLKHHEYSHTYKRPQKETSCVVCARSYSTVNDLLKHQRIVHVVTTLCKVTCQECKQVFPDQREYHSHKKKRFSSKTSTFGYKCDICAIAFPRKCDKIIHFTQNHSETEFPHKCVKCGSGFIGLKDLVRHRTSCKIKSSEKKAKSIKNEEYANCLKTKNPAMKNQTLRSSSRVSRARDFLDNEESDNTDDSTDEPQNTYSSMEDETENVTIKTENVEWIKEERSEFSDASD